MLRNSSIVLFITTLLLSSCAIRIIKKAPKEKPFLIENTVEVTNSKFTKIEKEAVIARLTSYIDDSAVVKIKSPIFFLDILKKPLAYDTVYSLASVKAMQESMYALGYYKSIATYTADTISGRKVKVKYVLAPGKLTLIDTLAYRLSIPNLQYLATKDKDKSIIQKNNPITKSAVLSELNRLVDTFKNNGYYKITTAELRMLGDTSIAALTQIASDPFEQLELLQQAELARDSPTIKLQLVINPTKDSSKLQQYTINNIYIQEDYKPGDVLGTSRLNKEIDSARNHQFYYHKKYILNSFFRKNILFKSGSLYEQEKYFKTVENLNRAAVWDRVTVRMQEIDSNRLNVFLELIPAKKLSFETSLEVSYSATSVATNPLGGNLFGIAGNLSLANRNIAKRAIKMTHNFRAGVEVNSGIINTLNSRISTRELTYNNNITFPDRLIQVKNKWFPKASAEAFLNTRLSTIARINLFNLNSISINQGTSYNISNKKKIILRPFNAEYNDIIKTDTFNTILNNNPFLRYSYTSSLIMGMSASYSSIYNNPKHLLSKEKERSLRVNIEESGLTFGALPIYKRLKSNFIKADIEYKYTVEKSKSAWVFRVFAGVGVPLFGDSSLPFFKQYFSGGSNSMRAWPIRGIGRGSQPRAPFGTLFNDRTGDIQIESNIEYRYDIARIIPNSITLRGALFTDIGNVWNFKSSLAPGLTDPAQFKFNKLYKELGVNVGTGFRLDFNYAIVRIDLGFRVKRPELANINSGWKLPPLSFNDVLQKLFTKGVNEENRKWRYDNFNLTFGINYPF